MNNTSSVLLTEGSISKKIIKFAIPIFFGNIFQQLYNIVDSIIVGNIVGKDALASIASTHAYIFLLVGLITGIFMGSGVVIAKYFGAKDIENVEKSIHTNLAFALIGGIGISILGIITAPIVLKLMHTPEGIYSNTLTYVQIYFSGLLFVVTYNAFSGTFQAVGDTKHPLYFLIISSVTNVVLDLLFVGIFNMNVGGAAFATIISQALSSFLAFRYLQRTKDLYHIDYKKVKINKPMLKEILKMGIPSGIQNSVIAIANMVVQSNINNFNEFAIAGCGAYSKIEGFVFIPITSFNFALTTFISQNRGAKEYKRAKKGMFFGIICSVTLAEIIGILFYFFAKPLIWLFNQDPEVINFGVSQARTITLFYFFLAFSHSASSVLRGVGKSTSPMIVMLASWCLIRVTYITITIHYINNIKVIFWAYPLTWCISSIILIYLLSKLSFKEENILSKTVSIDYGKI